MPSLLIGHGLQLFGLVVGERMILRQIATPECLSLWACLQTWLKVGAAWGVCLLSKKSDVLGKHLSSESSQMKFVGQCRERERERERERDRDRDREKPTPRRRIS